MGIKNYHPYGVSQKLLVHIENFKGKMEEQNAKISFQTKVINIKVKIIILWIWKGTFRFGRGTFALLAKKWRGHGPSGPPVPTSLLRFKILEQLFSD